MASRSRRKQRNNLDNYEGSRLEITGEGKQPSYTMFADMNLMELISRNIAELGYQNPTPIQRHAGPQLMAGLDVMGCSQTGSGKTAAYLLPVIQNLLAIQSDFDTDSEPVKPECVILAPTRELAVQIHREASLFSKGSILRCIVCYGGAPVFLQRIELQKGCNLLIATPGRLEQFVNEGTVSLENVKFFILDEADRMLDMGFMDAVKRLVDMMPSTENRVSGLFSATFPTGVQKAAAAFLKPIHVFVRIGTIGGACTDISQKIKQVEQSQKKKKLLKIIERSQDKKVLVFCNTKVCVDLLAPFLVSHDYSVALMHSDLLQAERELALRQFCDGTHQVLVASGVVARGIDFPDVGVVVNYDLPKGIDEYVQRIGRTGRLGDAGTAISFYEEAEDRDIAAALVSILREAHQKVPPFLVAGGYYGNLQDECHGFGFRFKNLNRGVPKCIEKDEDSFAY